MTEDERESEATEELVEDLNAPAESQDDVVGGAAVCGATMSEACIPPRCIRTTDRLPPGGPGRLAGS